MIYRSVHDQPYCPWPAADEWLQAHRIKPRHVWTQSLKEALGILSRRRQLRAAGERGRRTQARQRAARRAAGKP